LVALFLMAGIGRGDVVIVQKVEGAAQSGEMTLKVSGDKVRADVSPDVSTITDAATGDTTTLMHAQKAYMVISAAATKAMMAQMMNVMKQNLGGAAAGGAPKATGRTEKINGYNAAEYTFSNGILKATYWISTDYPNGKVVSDALAKFRQGGLADMTKAFSPDMSAIPGVPVRTETEFNGQKISTELVSATVTTVDPGEFQVPASYTEMKMPVPGGGN
jgi:hypothetical protein